MLNNTGLCWVFSIKQKVEEVKNLRLKLSSSSRNERSWEVKYTKYQSTQDHRPFHLNTISDSQLNLSHLFYILNNGKMEILSSSDNELAPMVHYFGQKEAKRYTLKGEVFEFQDVGISLASVYRNDNLTNSSLLIIESKALRNISFEDQVYVNFCQELVTRYVPDLKLLIDLDLKIKENWKLFIQANEQFREVSGNVVNEYFRLLFLIKNL